MPAPKGNQFWKKRQKHGRDKLFSTPEFLWSEVRKYFKWCDANPIVTIEYKGKYIQEVEYYHPRAYTWQGLEFFLNIDSFREYKTNELYKDFSQVIKRIELIMYEQKFTGAVAGVMNPNIIARDLGLKERTDVTTDDQPIRPLTDKEIDKRLNELEQKGET